MSTISTAELFNKDEWSDITIMFGGNQAYKAHKFVLSKNSSYFKKLLKEYRPSTIELDMADDGEAVECMLQWIYTFKYGIPDLTLHKEQDFHFAVAAVAQKYDLPRLKQTALAEVDSLLGAHTRRGDWRFQLEIAGTAQKHELDNYKDAALDKYHKLVAKDPHYGQWLHYLKVASVAHSFGLEEIKQSALAGFDSALLVNTNTATVVDALLKLPDFRYLGALVGRKEKALLKKHFLQIIHMPEYAKKIDEQPGQALAYLQQIATALSDIRRRVWREAMETTIITQDKLDTFVATAIERMTLSQVEDKASASEELQNDSDCEDSSVRSRTMSHASEYQG
ncbi:hypothetical protein LTS10_011041 [Elasticomyces elasticus]|nr:hypothetical protein LTS10_011041 [Elasticomyces elasticus]